MIYDNFIWFVKVNCFKFPVLWILGKFYFCTPFYDDLGFIFGLFWKIAVSGINLPVLGPVLTASNPVKIRFDEKRSEGEIFRSGGTRGPLDFWYRPSYSGGVCGNKKQFLVKPFLGPAWGFF